MKKNDYILIGFILIISITIYICFNLFSKEGEEVVITVDGVLYGSYELDVDQTIDINGTNILEIYDGEAFMIEADCPDSLCIYQGNIHQENESIICLPNRVVIEVDHSDEAQYDAISK